MYTWKNPFYLTVRAGSIYFEVGGQFSYVLYVIEHPDYDPDTLENDIAIIILVAPFLFTNTVNKIQLPAQGSSEGTTEGTELVVSGYGIIAEGTTVPADVLMQVTVPVTSVETCVEEYDERIHDTNVCAGKIYA